MKVLIACNRNSYKNPFVSTLADGIAAKGVDVNCSLDDFWHNWQQYDIIHLQWPNLLIAGLESVEPLKNHLQEIRSAGISLVITCHNLRPHYSKSDVKSQAYDVVYGLVDVFVHLGEYSRDLLEKQYSAAKHVVIQHHVYDTLYKNIPSRKEAVTKLGLNPNKRYILCLGAVRDREEQHLIEYVSQGIEKDNYKIIAPGYIKVKKSKNIFKWLSSKLQLMLKLMQFRNIICDGEFVPDEDLPYYYAASDIALIHRLEILNSGNLPMAFLMGKVVVGPNTGNVGPILKTTGNAVFETTDLNTVFSAVSDAVTKAKDGQGLYNRNIAQETMAVGVISAKYVELYKHCITS